MELNQTSISYYDKRLARISTCTETTDSIVPDTFPDIGRVVCAYGTAAVKDQTPQSGRLLISGAVQVTVLYEQKKAAGCAACPYRSALRILKSVKGWTRTQYAQCPAMQRRWMRPRSTAAS